MHQKFIAGKHFITQSRPHMYKLHNSILFSRQETIYFHRLFRKCRKSSLNILYSTIISTYMISSLIIITSDYFNPTIFLHLIFTILLFEMFSLMKLNFTGYNKQKNPVQTRKEIQFISNWRMLKIKLLLPSAKTSAQKA